MTKVPIKLSQIVDSMEVQSDEITAYLDREAGKVVLISQDEMLAAEDGTPVEEYPEWERDNVLAAQAIVQEDLNFIPLPDLFAIDDYRLMERFCLSLEDEDVSKALCRAIQGSGAFRRFKDGIHEHGVANDWYEYRSRAYREIAAEWCQQRDLAYVED